MEEKSRPWLSLSLAELRVSWTKAFGSAPPSGLGRALLARGLAWKAQEQKQGGIPARIERELRTLGRELERSGAIRFDRRNGLKPGTRLVRDWGGETHIVDVLEEGFFYRDQGYPSLSALAQTITGVKWSGPRFFGLRQSPRVKEPAADA